jgi:acyl-CoA synthetase (AMP-forming)/AMP-acid ligase II
MPLFHVHGLMAGTLAVLAAGGAVVLPAAGRFSAATFWPDAVENKVTFFTAVPTIHQILVSRAAADFPAAAPPPLRVIRSCSASLAPATLAAVEAAFGAPVLEAYAMTEAAHQMTSNPLPKHGPRRPGTVGKAQGSVSVAILDKDCAQLGVGAVGEVCVRGPNVTAGYRANPAANAEAYAGGWFHTGDQVRVVGGGCSTYFGVYVTFPSNLSFLTLPPRAQGFLDAEGYLTLTGRLKELINRGGEKISPLEVDAALLAHPEVAEAVSFAAPDEKYGDVVAAAVVLTPAGAARAAAEGAAAVAESVRAHCGASLSGFKVPAQVFLTDALPKNATGKIQRRFMVEAFMGGEKKDG